MPRRMEADPYALKVGGYRWACGCEGRIRVTSRQFKTGVPKWLRAHHFGAAEKLASLQFSKMRLA
jgi:hypothetical protein